MMLEVRSIRSTKQRAALRELQLTCLPGDEPVEASPGNCALGIYDGDRMVAFGMARVSRGYKKTLYLSRAGVHPDYRGQGLQKKLIAEREVWARRKGIQHAVTDTANTSTASMCSLIAAGYKPFWPRKVSPWALPESVYWRKAL